MREMERLIANLFPQEGPRLIDLKFFPGEQPVTVEEFCTEVHSAFVRIDAGQTNMSLSYNETSNRVSIDRFLATA